MPYEVRRVYVSDSDPSEVMSLPYGDILTNTRGYHFDGYAVYQRDLHTRELRWFRDVASLSDAVNIAAIQNSRD